MSYDVREIANLVLDFGEQAGIEMTNITINKIVFFLHAWYLVKTGNPLISAKIEAWSYGPVFRELYSEFKRFGKDPITIRATRRNPETAEKELCVAQLSEQDAGFLEELMRRYAPLSASKLIELSHVAGGPWDQVYNYAGPSNPGMHISDDLIREYFQTQTRH
jgi:uncharacterized phage-associated protein